MSFPFHTEHDMQAAEDRNIRIYHGKTLPMLKYFVGERNPNDAAA